MFRKILLSAAALCMEECLAPCCFKNGLPEHAPHIKSPQFLNTVVQVSLLSELKKTLCELVP